MIFVAGVLIIYEAVKNLIQPSPIHQLDIGIILISATAIINYIMGMLYAKTLLLSKNFAAADALLTKLQILPFEGATDGRCLHKLADPDQIAYP